MTLWTVCDDAKEKKKPCDYSSSLEDSSTIGGLCYLEGCNEKPESKRDGPGKSYCLYLGTLLEFYLMLPRRKDGWRL